MATVHAGDRITADMFSADWITLPLASGIIAANGKTPRFRKINSVVYLAGEFAGELGPPPVGDVGFLPSGYWPPEDVFLAMATSFAGARTYSSARLNVDADGVISYDDQDPNGLPAWVSLFGVTFSID